MKHYLDCEFDGLDGPLLSMALVSKTGKSMYVVMNATAQDEWARDNVVSRLFNFPANDPYPCILGADATQLSRAIEEFLRGDIDPHIIADWPDDIKYFCAAIVGPGKMIDVPRLKLSVKRVDAYPTELKGAVQHNAWWGAMALRALFVGPEYV